jgi:signal transduction histidine kinase
MTRYNRLKDSVYNLLKAEQIARVQAIYETEIHEKENSQLRSEKELRETQLNTQKNLITAITVGLGIAGVLVWILFRQRRKILIVNKDLEERHTEIHVQKSAIEDQAKALQNLNDKLQELNKSLENRIDERTQQLRLQNEKLSDFAFINAHRLRAPVASIQGLINLLAQADHKDFGSIAVHLKTCGDQLDAMTREMGRTLESAMVSEKKD